MFTDKYLEYCVSVNKQIFNRLLGCEYWTGWGSFVKYGAPNNFLNGLQDGWSQCARKIFMLVNGAKY